MIFGRDVALGDAVHVLGRDVDRGHEGVDQPVHAAHQLAPAAGELLGVAAGLQLALLGRLDQRRHFAEHRLEVRPHSFDRVVDECLLAGELLQRGLEVALAELGDAGHGLLLHGDVAAGHAVDAFGHRAVGALELLDRDRHVDVALVVLVRHAVHLGDEALEVGAEPLDGVVDEGFLAGELVQLGLEVALAELGDAGHGLLLHGDVAVDHLVDALAHLAVGALELVGRDRTSMSPASCSLAMCFISPIRPLRASMHWLRFFLISLKSPR